MLLAFQRQQRTNVTIIYDSQEISNTISVCV